MAHHSPQEISYRLEHYVFGIASHFIDSVDPPTQQALIAAASRFITLAATDPAADRLRPDNVRLDLPDPVDHQNLAQVTDQRLAHRAWLTSWAQRQQQSQRRHILYLEEALLVTQQQYQLIQETILREPYRSRLLSRYRRSLDHFQQCLDSAHTLTQSSVNWLNRLQYEKAT